MDLSRFKNLQPNKGKPGVNYERQAAIVEAAAIVGEPTKIGYWTGRFKKIPNNLIVAFAASCKGARNPAAVLSSKIKRYVAA